MDLAWLPLFLITGIVIAFLLHLLLPLGRCRSPGDSSSDRRFDAPIYRDDDRNWIGGILYNNPDDPDLFVLKRLGFGRTVNIGRPLGKVIMFGPLLLPIVLAVLKALSQR